jgi:capsular polysaccharide biosynthesis protein
MEHKDNDIIVIDLREIFFLLLHRSWIIVLITLLGAAVTFLSCMYLIRPLYSSATKVYVINRQEEDRTTYVDLQMGSQLTKDYSILVKSRPVLEQVIEDFNLDNDYEEFYEMVQVNTPEDTRILEIQVEYYDPELAMELTDAITRISSERMVSVMEMKKVNVLEPANYPIEPSSPKIIKSTLIGACVSFLLSSIVVVFIHLLNDSIKSSEDIERYLGITALGSIPVEDAKQIREKRNRELDEKNIAFVN